MGASVSFAGGIPKQRGARRCPQSTNLIGETWQKTPWSVRIKPDESKECGGEGKERRSPWEEFKPRRHINDWEEERCHVPALFAPAFGPFVIYRKIYRNRFSPLAVIAITTLDYTTRGIRPKSFGIERIKERDRRADNIRCKVTRVEFDIFNTIMLCREISEYSCFSPFLIKWILINKLIGY